MSKLFIMKNRTLSALSALGIIALIAVTAFAMLPSANNEVNNSDNESGIEITMFKSPNCGCCVQHSAYLEKNGFKVNVEMVDDMASVKQKFNIPKDMQSCHTAVMGDYFIEGHVPVEAFTMLIEDQPNIDGIALPAMPSGSPGMPGPKLGPFEIYQLEDGQAQPFINL